MRSVVLGSRCNTSVQPARTTMPAKHAHPLLPLQVCPLTLAPFIDPVLTTAGHVSPPPSPRLR